MCTLVHTTASGNVYMWGMSNKGQPGLGDTEECKTPTLLPPNHFNNEPVVCVAMGDDHTAFLTSVFLVFSSSI